ncbi:MAG: hypothetical protein AB1489_27450 [Acidobacteriota bacterium]
MREQDNRSQLQKVLSVVLGEQAIFTGALVLAFFLVALVGIVNHEMWQDELQAWLIARDSTTLNNLFYNLRYEGHPILWYLVLYAITRFTHDPLVMQLYHLLLATAVVYIIARFSPFTKITKLLFCFSYFPLYEYALISRSYALGLLLIFSCCALFPRRTERYIPISILLLLLANTSAYGLIIATALALTIGLDHILDRSSLAIANRKTFITGAGVFIAGAAIAVMQIIPPADSPHLTEMAERRTKTLVRFYQLPVTLITKSYLPLPKVDTLQFWNTNLIGDTVIATEQVIIEGQQISVILSITLLIAFLTLFSRRPLVLLLYLAATLAILLFAHLLYFGWLHHHGHLFIILIVCLWLSHYYSPVNLSLSLINRFAETIEKRKGILITILLLIHVTAGGFAYSMDLVAPFSESKETATFIRNQFTNNHLLVGSYASFPISGYLDRQIYYPYTNSFGSFIIRDSRRKVPDFNLFFDQLRDLARNHNEDILLVLHHELRIYKGGASVPLSFEWLNEEEQISISEVARFTNSIVRYEKYYLYLIKRKH